MRSGAKMFLDEEEEEIEQCAAAGTNDQRAEVHRLSRGSPDPAESVWTPTCRNCPNHGVISGERSHPCKFPINAPHRQRPHLKRAPILRKRKGTKEGRKKGGREGGREATLPWAGEPNENRKAFDSIHFRRGGGGGGVSLSLPLLSGSKVTQKAGGKEGRKDERRK